MKDEIRDFNTPSLIRINVLNKIDNYKTIFIQHFFLFLYKPYIKGWLEPLAKCCWGSEGFWEDFVGTRLEKLLWEKRIQISGWLSRLVVLQVPTFITFCSFKIDHWMICITFILKIYVKILLFVANFSLPNSIFISNL